MKALNKLIGLGIAIVLLVGNTKVKAQERPRRNHKYNVHLTGDYRHGHKANTTQLKVVKQSHYRAPQKHVKVVYQHLPKSTRQVCLNGIYYYHHKKSFYRVYPGGGYIRVSPPEFIHRIPHEVTRVYYRGQQCYHYKGLNIKYTPYGYIIL